MPRRRAVDHLREVALSLPEASEELTWEVHATFRVRSRIFVIVSEDGSSATIKATKEDQAALIAEAPEVYGIAAYVGRHGWVDVDLERADRDELTEVVTEAWRLTAPKRVVAAFDADG